MRMAMTSHKVGKLGLLALLAALALWGVTALAPVQSSANLALPAIADGQTNGPGGGGITG